MRIELNNLYTCKKCGCVFDYIIAPKEIKRETNYERSKIYLSECPACKKIHTIFE